MEDQDSCASVRLDFCKSDVGDAFNMEDCSEALELGASVYHAVF